MQTTTVILSETKLLKDFTFQKWDCEFIERIFRGLHEIIDCRENTAFEMHGVALLVTVVYDLVL